MNNLHTSPSWRCFAFCALAFGSPLLDRLQAQESLPVAALQLSASPILPGANAPDGRPSGIWATGLNYKVSFHDGMVFYPHVGAELVHQPVRWRTTSIRAGGAELLGGRTDLVPAYADFRCEYDLGAAIERYEVRTEGLEQSFVIAAKPAAGELVITGEITSPLQLRPRQGQYGAVAFCLPDGRQVVEYGTAIAIDANGVRTPVQTLAEGNRILLRVAAETIAAASFPLVIDPLLTNTLLEQGTPVEDVDVLHETVTVSGIQARSWVAISRIVAAGDGDVFLYRLGSGWGGTPSLQYREITNWDAAHPRIALAPASGHVVLVHSTDSGSNRFVWLHRHVISDNNLRSSVVVVPGNLGLSDWRPDVGGRIEPNGTKVLIVFQREAVAPFVNTATSTVQACVFDANEPNASLGFTVQPFPVLPRNNADQENPVANQSSSDNHWLVAFQEHNGAIANDDWDIQTTAVDGLGSATQTGLDVAQSTDPLLHKVGPEIGGTAGRYLLTYGTRAFELATPKPAQVRGSAIYAQRIHWNHVTNVGSLPHPVVALQSAVANGLWCGSIGFDPVTESHWCASVSNAIQGNYRVYKLGYTGNVVESANIGLGTNATPVAIAVSWNGEHSRFQIAYGANSTVANDSRVYGTQLSYDAVTPAVTVGNACGSGVWANLAATAKRQVIGSEDMPLRLANAPEDSIAVLMVSLAEANTPGANLGAPGCVLVPDTTPGILLAAPLILIHGGAAATTLDLPEWLPPLTLSMQWGYLVTGVNPLGALASEGLRVQLGR